MNQYLFFIVLVSVGFLTMYNLNIENTTGFLDVASDIQNPIIYEISLRPWLFELSKKYSKGIQRLNDIPISEFQHLKSIGVDYVWLMGIWKLGQYGVNFDKSNQDQISYYKSMIPDFTMDDIIGSPYAVYEFTCNPDLGTDQDIAQLKKTLNGLGLKLMLDFVPNHSSVDSPFIVSNPDYYIRAPKGTQPPFDSQKYLPNGISYGGDQWDGLNMLQSIQSYWKDTAQWNYWNPNTRAMLKQVVMKIASLSDGMRCDMGMVILNDLFYNKWQSNLDSWGYKRPSQEFWREAISETKAKYPNVIFLAEVYWGKEQELINNGFDLVYEKQLLDKLSTRDIGQVKQHIDNLSNDYAKHSNHFVENHDEPRAIQKFGGQDYLANVAAMISYTLPGAKFINHGQLEGLQNKLDVHLRRSAQEKGSDYTKWFYQQLLPIISRSAFHQNSNWSKVQINDSDSWRFLAWRVTNQQEKILVIINYSSSKSSCRVIVPDTSSGQIEIVELMSNQKYIRNGDEMRTTGLQVVIDAWNGQIFKY